MIPVLVLAAGLHYQHVAGAGIPRRAQDVAGAGDEQPEADTIPVRSALGPDAEVEVRGVDRQITDRCVRNLAFDPAASELYDLAARAGDDFLQLLEAVDLLPSDCRELPHRAPRFKVEKLIKPRMVLAY